MGEQLPKRSEVSEQLKWDLTALFQDETAFEDAKSEAKKLTEEFIEKHQGQLQDAETVLTAIEEMEALRARLIVIGQYAFLPVSVDITDKEASVRMRRTTNELSELSARLSFFTSELVALSNEVLDEVAAREPQYEAFIRVIKKAKASALSPDVEKALATLSPVLEGFYDLYEQMVGADPDFGTFEVDGKEYPLTFVLYEEYYMFHRDPRVRQASYEKFNEVLGQYQQTMANAYYHHVLKEKTEATMRGYDSVFDFLLESQEVSRELYDRQIDTLMKDFAPVMQKYITHLKEENGLETMNYADLKIDLDPKYAPEVTIEESKQLVADSISLLGEDYVEMILRGYDERWIDFSRNIGKQSGAFCSTSYGYHPYIMLTWSDLQSDVYTLTHELGHAGQGLLSGKHQTLSGSRPSLYLIEAPSTFHELLLSDHLSKAADSLRAERAVIANMISETYFHNFVTHLLEAAYQREVYRIVDRGESFDAEKLSELKRAVLEEFWGDAVELEPGAELTWMRQPHYYMGLYPYTYSAGLTIATQAYLKLRSGEIEPSAWLDFLKLGGTLEPVEAAAVAGVDIATDDALQDTIAYLDESVDRMIELTVAMKHEEA